jgi:hypothetical protein
VPVKVLIGPVALQGTEGAQSIRNWASAEEARKHRRKRKSFI